MLHLLFPRKCILCKRVLARTRIDLCDFCREDTECWKDEKRKLQFLDSFTAVWYYEGYVRSSILRFKFYRARHLAPGFGRCIALKLSKTAPEGFDILTWVPISRRRKLTRGYDQCALLAKTVGKELGIPVLPLLKKIRNNKPQSSVQGVAQRRANVLGVYKVLTPDAVQGKRILLLDDVLTTGSTAGECARMLLTAGAKEVHCAAIAAVRK